MLSILAPRSRVGRVNRGLATASRGVGLAALVACLGMIAYASPAWAVQAGPLNFAAPLLVDHQYPYSSPQPFDTMSCPTTSLCVGDAGNDDNQTGVGTGPDDLVSSTDPSGTESGTWSVVHTAQIAGDSEGYILTGVSCASSSFCLAAGSAGTDGVLLTSTDPTGGAAAWTPTTLTGDGFYLAPSCVTGGTHGGECVAATFGITSGDLINNVLWVATDPAGNSGSDWTEVTPFSGGGVPLGPGSGTGEQTGAFVSCASSALCMAIDTAGDYVTSSTAGSTSWHAQQTIQNWPSGYFSESVSCPTASFCLVYGTNDLGGSVIATTTTPLAATPAWTVTTPTVSPTSPVSCFPDSAALAPSHVMCVDGTTSEPSGVYTAGVLTSLDGGATWSTDSFTQARGTPSGDPLALACPGGAGLLCVAGTTTGAVVHSGDPGSGASATWSAPLPADAGTSFPQFAPVSCPSSSLCVAYDSAGNVVTSTDPASGRWSVGNVDPNGITALACPTASLCVATDDVGNVVDSTDPAAGASSWSTPALVDGLAPRFGFQTLNCVPGSSLCVATDTADDMSSNIFESGAPGDGPTSWSTHANVASGIADVACPSTTLCVATDNAGNVLESTNPAADTWSAPSPVPAATGGFFTLACPSSDLCLAGSGGSLLASTNPGAGSSWKAVATDASSTISSIFCASVSLCAASDFAGAVLASTQPGTSWSGPTNIDTGNEVTGLDCPATDFCVATDSAGNVLTASDPVTGPLTWSGPVKVDGSNDLLGTGLLIDDGDLACPSTGLCVIGDQNGNVIVGSGAGVVTTRPPVNTGLPAISGVPRSGGKLSCSNGSWSNSPTHFAYLWSVDGTPIQGATAPSYTVQSVDEGISLTCTVTAANTAGPGAPATSKGVSVPVPVVRRCPRATGSIGGLKLGLLALGMTRAQARHAYTKSSTRGRKYVDFFCLTPRGVRAGYASPQLVDSLPRSQRRKLAGRVVWASTASLYYAIDGVRAGATVAAAGKHLKLAGPFVVGKNEWYLAPAGEVTAVLKVRGGIVEEIGIGNKQITKGRKAQRTFLTSFS